jgi:predicted nuclease of predicted toxin-antitoxin system
MRLLIDECLHTSLVKIAHESGVAADHVTHLGLSGLKDWQIMETVIQRDYIFVTNNRTDFLALYRKHRLHPGLVILVPNVTPGRQQQLLGAVLLHLADREPVNAVIEATFSGDDVECAEYPFAASG